MGRPVVFHGTRMVDRNVGGSLIAILYWIAASLHYRRHQIVCFRDGPLRGIDKAGLHRLPLFRKSLVFCQIKIANVELFNPLLAIR